MGKAWIFLNKAEIFSLLHEQVGLSEVKVDRAIISYLVFVGVEEVFCRIRKESVVGKFFQILN